MHERIKRRRELLGLTQQEVADQCGVLSLQVSRWERKISKPRQETLERLAGALDVDVRWLAFGGEDLSPNEAA